MKKMLWEQLGVESAIPTKPYNAKAIFPSCAEDSSFDVAEVIPGNSINSSLLLSILLVVSFSFPKQPLPQGHNYSDLNYFNTPTVPIYLKLGQLIYYS
jgi:hypothetical protein